MVWIVSSRKFPVAVVGRRDWETVVSGTTKMTASGGEMAYLSRRNNHEKLAKGGGGGMFWSLRKERSPGRLLDVWMFDRATP